MYETHNMTAEIKTFPQTVGYMHPYPVRQSPCPTCGRCPTCGGTPYHPYTPLPVGTGVSWTLEDQGNISGCTEGAATRLSQWNCLNTDMDR